MKWNICVLVFQANQTRVDVPKKAGDGHDEVGEYSVLLELLSDAIVYMCTTFTAIVAPKWVTTAPTRNAIFRAFSALDLCISRLLLFNAIPFHAYDIILIKSYILFLLHDQSVANLSLKTCITQPRDIEIAQQMN